MSVFCLHRFALSTNPRIIPAEISRYRLLSMSVSLISRQPMKLQISFGFARAMPTTNPRTGMLWERDCLHAHNFLCAFFMNYYVSRAFKTSRRPPKLRRVLRGLLPATLFWYFGNF